MDNMIDKNLWARCCWQVLVLTTLSVLVFPETFSSSHWLGQTWLWLTATPVCMLLVLHRHRFAAAWSAALVYSPPRRRRQSSFSQARRKGFGRTGLRQNPMRAA
ncbi:MAG: hypothetical protein ACREO1_06690 [Arenimonas sp.]